MKLIKYISICLLLTAINSQTILKDGEKVTTFTYDEALEKFNETLKELENEE